MEIINIKTYLKTIGLFTIFFMAVGILSLSIESARTDSKRLINGYHLMTYNMKDVNMNYSNIK